MNFSPAVIGLLLSTGAFALFSGFDFALKTLVGKFPSAELASTVYSLSGFFLFIWLLFKKRGGWIKEIRVQKTGLHVVRGLAHATALGTFMLGLAHMPLANYYVVGFMAPLFVPLFAFWVLREKPHASLWVALAVSFAGVIVAFHPTAQPNMYVLLCLAASAFYGFSFTLLRKMAATESPYAIMLSLNAVVGLSLFIVSLPQYVLPDARDMFFFSAAALCNVFGYYMVTRAAQLAPASLVVAPQFLQLVYGAMGGYLLFAEVPTQDVLLGGGIVVAANLYLIFSENKKRLKPL